MSVAGAAGAQEIVGAEIRRPDRGRMHGSAHDHRYSEPVAPDRRYARGQIGSRRSSHLSNSKRLSKSSIKPKILRTNKSTKVAALRHRVLPRFVFRPSIKFFPAKALGLPLCAIRACRGASMIVSIDRSAEIVVSKPLCMDSNLKR